MSEAKQTAKLALEALEDKKAMDVRILDLPMFRLCRLFIDRQPEATATRYRRWQTT